MRIMAFHGNTESTSTELESCTSTLTFLVQCLSENSSRLICAAPTSTNISAMTVCVPMPPRRCASATRRYRRSTCAPRFRSGHDKRVEYRLVGRSAGSASSSATAVGVRVRRATAAVDRRWRSAHAHYAIGERLPSGRRWRWHAGCGRRRRDNAAPVGDAVSGRGRGAHDDARALRYAWPEVATRNVASVRR